MVRSAPAYLLAELDRATSPSGEKDPVSRLDRHGVHLAVLVRRAGTHGDDRRLG